MDINGAGIQIEDGNWSKLHNRILEVLATAPLSGAEFRCLMFLLRQTYGWKKKHDTISMAQWAEATGLERRSVIRTVQELLAKNIIYRIDNGERKPATWGFNKYVEKWKTTVASDQTDTSKPSDQNDISDNLVTRTSDQIVTNASDQIVTLKRYRKIKKEKAAALPALLPESESDKDGKFTIQLIQDTNLFFHFGTDAKKKAMFLEQTYRMEDIRRGVEIMVERHKAMAANGKGIRDPVSFLTTILAEDARPVKPKKPKEKMYIIDQHTGKEKEVWV